MSKEKITYREMYEFIARYMHQEGVEQMDFFMYLNADMLTLNVLETRYISQEADYASTNNCIDVNYLFEVEE